VDILFPGQVSKRTPPKYNAKSFISRAKLIRSFTRNAISQATKCEIFVAHKIDENFYNTISFLVFEIYF